MTAKAFINWESFASLEPWTFYPELRDDYRAASIRKSIDDLMCVVIAILGGRRQPKSINDLRMHFDEDHAAKKPPQTLEQQWKILNVLAAMYSNES